MTTVTKMIVWSKDDDEFFWCIVPDGMTEKQAIESQYSHGPFLSEREADDDAARVITGGKPVTDSDEPFTN